MSEIQLAHFAWGESPGRSRIHDVAIRDARIAAEAHAVDAPAAPRLSFVQRLGAATRVRLAFAGGPVASPDACSCPA